VLTSRVFDGDPSRGPIDGQHGEETSESGASPPPSPHLVAPQVAERNVAPARGERLRTFAKRVARALADELRFDVRKTIAQATSTLLPHPAFQRTRTTILRLTGVKVGSRSGFLGPLEVTGPADMNQLSIGNNTFITGHLHIDLGAPVRIGDGVRIGHHVALLTLEFVSPGRRCGEMVAGPIVIEDGAWLASCVTILPGVTIGKGAIVAAGAVVTHDVAPNTLVGGVPARPVRDLEHDGVLSTRRRMTMRRSE
jgi:maltose O-acetyltransferase